MTNAPTYERSALETLRDLMSAYAVRCPVTSVTVVANAPLSADPARAAVIDASDLVIRVNGFRLDEPGSPQYVGRRADVVVFTRGSPVTPWVFREYRRRLYLLVEPARMHWEPESWPDWWPADLGYVPVPNRAVVVPLADELGLPMRDEPRWATTGTIAAWLAVSAFPEAEVRITGYSFIDEPDQQAWGHAYGGTCAVSPEHALSDEGQLLRGWEQSGRLRILS